MCSMASWFAKAKAAAAFDGYFEDPEADRISLLPSSEP